MKKKIKENSIFFIIFLFLLSLFLFNVYKYMSNANNLKKRDLEIREECKKEIIKNPEKKQYCMEVKNAPKYKIDFYSMFFSTFTQGYFYYLTYIMFLIVVIPTILRVTRFFKNNMFKNYLTRQSYKKTICKLFLSASKSVFILPVLTFIAFIVCYICTGNFDFKYALEGSYVTWSENSMTNPLIFTSIYILKIFLISILYNNIALCVCKKNQNFFAATIISYLVFLGLEIFLEVGCNMIIFNIILKSNFGTILNILSIFSLFDYYGLFYSILVPTIFVIISIVILYLIYVKKEQVIIECEKNE